MGTGWQNDRKHSLALFDGEWEFRLGDAPPILVTIPSAWETYTADKIIDGPALYRRTFEVPADRLDRRLVLEARAISYHAAVRVNGQLAGEHAGLWSPFQIELTPFVRAGQNEIEIEAWKPGRRYPLRETLSGFLPDVCTPFGGIWQELWLHAFADAAFYDLRTHARGDGRLTVHGRVENWSGRAATRLMIEVAEADGRPSLSAPAQLDRDGAFSATLNVPGVARWGLGAGAHHYLVNLTLHAGDQVLASLRRRVAFRDIDIHAGVTRLNGQPLYFRGVLDWGWNPVAIRPAAFDYADQFASARALGFNLWKLCLYVPPEAFFDAADEAGLLVWLEMPLWLPRVTPALKALALQEYEAVFRRVHHHPSIAIVSLGCELDAQADADFLRALHAQAREWFPNALICDNSGSAEAYGGVEAALSDFYDYHFYTDPHFFGPLVQHFNRGYRPEKPWLYGEFCDADTLRDFSQLEPGSPHADRPIRKPGSGSFTAEERRRYANHYGELVEHEGGLFRAATDAWWLHDRVALDREDYRYQRDYHARLSAAGVSDEGATLTTIARRQATAIRKFILETVRRDQATGGYVVTGWIDTPITTSGIVDDARRLKFVPDEWRPFNADVVLTIDRERRRRWVGGDRPLPKDPHVWWQGERAEVHVVVSNGTRDLASGELTWRLTGPGDAILAQGAHTTDLLPGGAVREVAVITFTLPAGPAPIELTLTARLQTSASSPVDNAWQLWAIPRPRLPVALALDGRWPNHGALASIDRAARLVDAAQADRGLPIIAGELSAALLARVRGGARALLWRTLPDQRFTRTLPFWREAIHVFEPHALWRRVPQPGHADLRFFSIAADIALDAGRLAELLGAPVRPVWRRFDARQMTWADYVVEAQVGGGRLLVTTLRLEGGLGAQPVTFETNPMGAWMLAALLESLERD